MKNKKIFILFYLVLMSSSFLYVEEALACCGASVAINTQTQSDKVIGKSLELSIEGMKKSLSNSISASGDSIIAAIKATSELQMNQKKQLAEAQSKDEVVAVCGGPASSLSIEKTKSAGLGVVSSASSVESSKLTNDINKITNMNNKHKRYSKLLVSEHFDTFCSESDSLDGICNKAAPDLENADVRADVLFSEAYKSPDEQKAAKMFISRIGLMNATSSASEPGITPLVDVKKMGLYQRGQNIAALNSIVSSVFSDVVAERTPNKNPKLQSIFKTSSANPSELELMDKFAEVDWERIGKQGNFTMRDSEYKVQSLKNMEFQNYLLLQQYKKLTKSNVVLASLLALQLKSESKIFQAFK